MGGGELAVGGLLVRASSSYKKLIDSIKPAVYLGTGADGGVDGDEVRLEPAYVMYACMVSVVVIHAR